MNMVTIKTSELTGPALDWAVNHAKRLTGILAPVTYCGKWEHGGPIIEHEKLGVGFDDELGWVAIDMNSNYYMAPTPLVAAMRCYVASKLGDTVEIPKELL